MGDRWTLELLLAGGALDQRRPHARGQVSHHLSRRDRDAAEGLHRLLRPDRRVSAADAPKASTRAGRPTRMPACAPCWRRWSPSSASTRRSPACSTRCRRPCRRRSSGCGWRPARRRSRDAPVDARLGVRPRAGAPRASRRPFRITAPTSSCAAAPALAREFGVGLHSHVQESKAQVIVGLKRYGKTPTAHLQDLGLLGPDFTVAHGVWLDDDDMQRLGRSRRIGRAQSRQQHAARQRHRRRARACWSASVNVGIGTDGANCSDNLNMYESMRLASMVSNAQGPDYRPLAHHRRRSSTPRPTAARRALGFGDRLGRIAPGYKADIVFLDLAQRELDAVQQCGQPAGAYRGRQRRCIPSWSAGAWWSRTAASIGVDMAALARRVEEARARLEGATRAEQAAVRAASSRSSTASARGSPRCRITSTASAAGITGTRTPAWVKRE